MLSVSEEKGGQVTCAPSTTKRATTDRYETRARLLYRILFLVRKKDLG